METHGAGESQIRQIAANHFAKSLAADFHHPPNIHFVDLSSVALASPTNMRADVYYNRKEFRKGF